MVEKQLAQFPYLHSIADVFLKKESGKLPPHCKSDYKITLTTSNLLSTSPLYFCTPDQLETMKKYLIENLHNGFIELSSALYRSPVLFAIKGDSIWQICVDYWKLNASTVKNKYPILLIDKILH